MLKLYRPNPGSETLHVSEEDLGDIQASCIGTAVAFSPATCVLTADQCAKLALASRAAAAFLNRKALPPTVEIVDGPPPEWAEEVEAEEVPA